MSKSRIIESVRNLDLKTTRELLDATPSLLNVTDRQGRNLLHLACSASCPNLKVPESTATRMVSFLLDCGMDLESPLAVSDCDTVNALWFAVARGRNRKLVKLLIDRGAKVNGLYAAGWYEDMDILDLLIRGGAEIDVPQEQSPFLACWNWKRFKAAKYLVLKGADPNYQDRNSGKTALHYGIEKEFDPALLRWLVSHGASPDVEDRHGTSARAKASRKRNKKFLAALQGS